MPKTPKWWSARAGSESSRNDWESEAIPQPTRTVMITSIGLLIVTLIEHVGLIVAAAFILLSMAPVQPMMLERASLKHRLFLTLFFGIFGIMGTYGGNLIFDSFAN